MLLSRTLRRKAAISSSEYGLDFHCREDLVKIWMQSHPIEMPRAIDSATPPAIDNARRAAAATVKIDLPFFYRSRRSYMMRRRNRECRISPYILADDLRRGYFFAVLKSLSHSSCAPDGGDARRLQQDRAAAANHDVRGRAVRPRRQAARLQYAGAAHPAAGRVSRGRDHRGTRQSLRRRERCLAAGDREGHAKPAPTRSSSTTAARRPART